MTRVAPLGGATRVTAVSGDPVEHRSRPRCITRPMPRSAWNRVYAAFHVTPPMLAAALRALPALGIAGVNLTVPHKERALKMVAKLSAEARMLGAINCVVNRMNRSGGLYGDNSDARGLERDLDGLGVAIKGGMAVGDRRGRRGRLGGRSQPALRRERDCNRQSHAGAGGRAGAPLARAAARAGRRGAFRIRTRRAGRRGAAGARRDCDQRDADGSWRGALCATRLRAHRARMYFSILSTRPSRPLSCGRRLRLDGARPTAPGCW